MTRLLLIGAAGLDWAGLASRLRSGLLPNIAALQGRGMAGWLSTPPPREGLAAWTSLATGRMPEEHGVYRHEEAWLGGLRPVSRASWRAPALWARLAQAGVSTGGVAWPGARAGADWPGVHLDEDFSQPTGIDADGWALPPRCAAPDVREAIRDLRVHPADITAGMLAPLVPDLARLDQSRDQGLPRLAVTMARAATIQAAAAWLLTERKPEAVFVHQPWLGEVRAAFEGQREGPFAQVMDGAWRFLDGLVGRLAELAGPNAAVILACPGWRGSPGVLAAAGAGVGAADFQGAETLDLAPSVLARFGLEDGGLPGRIIPGLAPEGPRAPTAPWASPPPPAPDAKLLQAARDAGFAPPPPAPAKWRAQGFAELALMLAQRAPAPAVAAADAALALDADHAGALCFKAMAHIALEEADPLPALAEALRRAAPQRGWGALAQGAFHVLRDEPAAARPFLLEAEADPEPETLLAVAAAWLAAERPVDAERVFKAILARDRLNASAEIGLAITAMGRRDFMAAEPALQRALALDPARPAAYLQLAQLYAVTGRSGLAQRAAASAARLGAALSQVDAARQGRLGR